MSLREAIADNHSKAEAHQFVANLLGKTMPSDAYAAYLLNQAKCYKALERRAYLFGLLDGIEGIARAALIRDDAEELGADDTVFASTVDYVKYVNEVPKKKLLAHIYVRHFADMYGGQVIKRVAPGSCKMYEFEDRPGLIVKVRERLSEDLGDEANLVFEYVLRLFDEVCDVYNIQPIDGNC